MRIRINLASLKQIRWHEYLTRFLLGGIITVATGLIAKHFGPVIGGLFLAFPAIFPAGATLIEKHEREKEAPRWNPSDHSREIGGRTRR